MSRPPLPPLITVPEIHERLSKIFPEGTPNRGYCTREIAAKTVFVMLYIGAIEDDNRFLRPDQVTRMTDTQAIRIDEESRSTWAHESLRKAGDVQGRWYAANTREPIRDETLREGLIRTGAVMVRAGLPTTSAIPRYALRASFAALLNPHLTGGKLESEITRWQAENLSKSALARIRLLEKGAISGAKGVLVTFPNGETRRLAEGPSSIITKAVVEEFSKRFLGKAGVIFLSESGNKVVARDEALARDLGLIIPADRYLPDILLVDESPKEPLLIFVEVVATDGPITESRKRAFLDITKAAGLPRVAFVTAYGDRDGPAFRRTVSALAWQSFAWFVSEPDHILILREGNLDRPDRLSDLL
jgi:hypothetical protein